MGSLEEAHTKALAEFNAANDRVAVAELHVDNLKAHYSSGAWQTTYGTEAKLAEEADRRNREVSEALAERALAQGRLREAEQKLVEQKQRQLAAEAAKKAAQEKQQKPKPKPDPGMVPGPSGPEFKP